MSLTKDEIAHLKRPYTPEAVKWRADQKTPDAAGNCRCLVYLDSGLVRERLSDVDPSWSAYYRFMHASASDPIGHGLYAPTMCELKVKGITRIDIGTIQSIKPSPTTAKAAISDALKRAAVNFGIGAYLRAMPVFKVDSKGYWKKGSGDVGGLTPDGVKQLRQQYTKIVTHKLFVERWGEPIDYGDVADDERSSQPMQLTVDAPPATPKPRTRSAR